MYPCEARNGKCYIEGAPGDFSKGERVLMRTYTLYEATPGVSTHKREKLKESGALAVIGERRIEFVITGLGQEFVTDDGEARQRFYGHEHEIDS